MKLRGFWPSILYYIIRILINNLKMHTNARDLQFGEVIIQKGKPITLYSRKVAHAQKRYTVK